MSFITLLNSNLYCTHIFVSYITSLNFDCSCLHLSFILWLNFYFRHITYTQNTCIEHISTTLPQQKVDEDISFLQPLSDTFLLHSPFPISFTLKQTGSYIIMLYFTFCSDIKRNPQPVFESQAYLSILQ